MGKNKLAVALRQAGCQVEIHDDHFPPNAIDPVWLTEAGKRGWIVITKDKRIRYRTLELTALMNAKVRTFVLTGGNLHGEEVAQLLVRILPRLKNFLTRHKPPFIAAISRGGTISLLRGNDPS